MGKYKPRKYSLWRGYIERGVYLQKYCTECPGIKVKETVRKETGREHLVLLK